MCLCACVEPVVGRNIHLCLCACLLVSFWFRSLYVGTFFSGRVLVPVVLTLLCVQRLPACVCLVFFGFFFVSRWLGDRFLSVLFCFVLFCVVLLALILFLGSLYLGSHTGSPRACCLWWHA